MHKLKSTSEFIPDYIWSKMFIFGEGEVEKEIVWSQYFTGKDFSDFN